MASRSAKTGGRGSPSGNYLYLQPTTDQTLAPVRKPEANPSGNMFAAFMGRQVASVDYLCSSKEVSEEWSKTHRFTWDKEHGGRVIQIGESSIQHGDSSTIALGSSSIQHGGPNGLPTPENSPVLSARLAFCQNIISNTPSLSPSTSSTTPTSTSSLSSATTAVPLFTTKYFAVLRSPKGGYGAFATEDIAAGTVVLKEKALMKATTMQVYHAFEGLTPHQRKEYGMLYGYMALSGNRIEAIFMTNQFRTPSGAGAIFSKSSRFNHACVPFRACTYSYSEDTDCLTIVAARSIRKGEEITICYTSNPATLIYNYGFYCDCPACPAPQAQQRIAEFMGGPCW